MAWSQPVGRSAHRFYSPHRETYSPERNPARRPNAEDSPQVAARMHLTVRRPRPKDMVSHIAMKKPRHYPCSNRVFIPQGSRANNPKGSRMTTNAFPTLRVPTFLSSLCLASGLVSKAGLVARWTFDEAKEGTVADTSGRFAARINDESGRAGIRHSGRRSFFSVPGTHSGDYVTLGEGDAFDLPRQFTLEAWFRPHPAPERSYTLILGKRYNRQFQLSWASSGGGTIEFYVGGGDLRRHRVWKSRVSTGRWLHVVAVYDGTRPGGPNQWLYLNGSLARENRNEAVLQPDRGALRIAQNSDLNLQATVPADWDEVALYDHPMSAREVARVYAEKAIPAVPPEGSSWTLPLEPADWQPPEPDRGRGTDERDAMSGIVRGTPKAPVGRYVVKESENGLRFRVEGTPPETRSARWRRTLETPVDLTAFPYCLVTYRARGLERAGAPLPVLSLEGSGGGTVVVTSSHLILDNLPHTCLSRPSRVGTVEAVSVDLRTRGSMAELELREVRFLRTLEDLPAGARNGAPQPSGPFAVLPLPQEKRRPIADLLRKILTGEGHAAHHPTGSADLPPALAGIPFAPEADNAVWWPPEKDPNAEKITAFGQPLSRESYFPEARDERLELPVGRSVSEVFLRLVCDLPALRKRYSRPPIPWGITDVEAIDVELVYSDGGRESVFPYSLRDRGYRILGLVGAYAVAADPKRTLATLILHNRMRGYSVGIAAATANPGDPILPEIRADPPPLRPPAPPRDRKGPSSIRLIGDGLLKLENACLELLLDCRDGFAIRGLRNRLAPGADCRLAPESGLEVRIGHTRLSGRDFQVRTIQVTGSQARIDLDCRRADIPLALELTFRIDQGPELLTGITARNTGTEELRADIRFPVLRGMSLGEEENTWIFFPQYRNVITPETRFCKQPNHRGFLMQFMDIFNPVTGGGVALMTRNPDQQPVRYCLAKTPDGVLAYIENEGEDFPLPGGASVRFCDRVIAIHGGDWREAARLYRSWVDGWYRPVHSQDKPWFRRAAWFRSHISSPKNAQRIAHAPPLYDPEKKVWRTDDFLARDERLLGTKPDLFHFYVWAFDENTDGDVARDGEYGPPDYANLGGLASFRGAIDHLRSDLDLPVSLYTIWDRYNRDTPFYRKWGDRFAKVRFTGQRLVSDRKIYISQGVPEWRAHAARTLKRLQAETGADVLYLDVFGTDDRARCFNPDAGHAHVPAWVARDDSEFLRALRHALPRRVALWGEFPVPDVASQYWDGFLSYDCIPLHTYMAEAYDRLETAPKWSENTFPPNVFRFLFPHIRQVVFPVGTEGVIDNWRFLKFLLYNGQALFDTTWRLYDSRCRKRLGKVLRIQQGFADCFDSGAPEMLVPTERGRVFANRFPGDGRTLWTLFNGRYRTVSGPLLRVRHEDRARYRDVWGDRPLSPRIENGEAILELSLPPQGVGCVVRETPGR